MVHTGRRLPRLALIVFALLTASCQSGPSLGDSPDLNVVCRAANGGVAPDCVADVTRLNGVLTEALKALLSSEAAANNNLRSETGPVGGTGPTFHPRVIEGDLHYEAPIRLQEDKKAANLHIIIDRWDIMPEGQSCLMSAEAVAEEKSKGTVVHRCDRTVDAAGNTILVSDVSRPYGANEFAKILARDFHVTAFRKDSAVITVSVETVVNTDPDRSKTGDLPTMLTLEQAIGLALNSGFRLSS